MNTTLKAERVAPACDGKNLRLVLNQVAQMVNLKAFGGPTRFLPQENVGNLSVQLFGESVVSRTVNSRNDRLDPMGRSKTNDLLSLALAVITGRFHGFPLFV